MTPSKRPFQKNSSDYNGRGKCQKTKHSSPHKSQFKIEPGVPIFRILCPASKSGNVIGKAGAIIAKIREETRMRIRVDRAAPGCDERVIFITAAEKDEEASSERGGENDGGVADSTGGDLERDKDSSKEENDDPEGNNSKEQNDDSEKGNGKEEEDGFEKDHSTEEKDDSERDHIREEKDHSEKEHDKEEKDDPFVAEVTKSEPEKVIPSALKAVSLVFDRIFAAEDNNETGNASAASTPVNLRLLVLYSQAGWLLGKGGSVIKQMSADNGCEIRVLRDNLPSCALLNDKLCQV
jgi:poly(rC)-binding protein 2/3/4